MKNAWSEAGLKLSGSNIVYKTGPIPWASARGGFISPPCFGAGFIFYVLTFYSLAHLLMPSNLTPIIILTIVFVLIAIRQIGSLRLHIWQVMAGGAAAAVITGSIGPFEALRSVNLDVIVFLLGMFIVGEALVESGYLYHVSYGLFKSAKKVDSLVLLVLFVLGFFSAFLMNDTIAIIGAPLVLFFAERHGIPEKLMLLALCFAVTLGSVASPIGNPQNLLIAINGNVGNPFTAFFKYLAVPTVINLFLAYLVLKFFYRAHFHDNGLNSARDEVKDQGLATLSKYSLAIIFVMVAVKITGVFFGFDFRLTYIAVAAALPIILFSPKRLRILQKTDWHTLIFFAGLFILMESVWRTGLLQGFIAGAGMEAASIDVIFVLSVLLSQLLSNVPFVALYLPVLSHAGAGTEGMMALAAGSTIAGNLLILGAASNIIIIQNAEKRRATITFFEFARAGIPLTVLNTIVYWGYLKLVG